MPPQPVLDYETVQPNPTPFWRRSALVWTIIVLIMYSFSIASPLAFVLGIYSLLIDPHGSVQMGIMGVPLRTLTARIAWTLSNLVISTLAVWFVAWNCFPKRSGDGT
jgi:hypothetical protein